jgi:hypothetical protein
MDTCCGMKWQSFNSEEVKMNRLVLLCLLVVSWSHAPLLAQSARAVVSGTVYDRSGAVVPSAKVVITGKERNTRDTRTTNEVGRYLFSDLTPGQYQLEVTASGFKVARTDALTLDVGQQLEINPRLEVGNTGETVTVSAASVELETTNATVSGVVTPREVSDLPLNSRDFYSLLQLVPNVRAGVPSAGTSAEVPAINGSRSWGVEASVDGAPATAMGANPAPGAASPAYITGLDNVAEFRVITNNLPAEYGNTNGGYISVVTKSGANMVHGSLFEYLRNSITDANNFFSNRAGLPRGNFKRHQFGATLGGPIVKNKTFFFVYYDGLRSSSGVNNISSVPTALQRGGDFSQTFSKTGAGLPQLITIYDPQTTTTNAAGTASVRAPFPNNVIPLARLDPVAQKLTALLPPTTSIGDPITHANDLVTAGVNTSNQDKYDVRIDHRFNDAHAFFARGSYTNSASTIAAPLGPLDNNVARVQPVWNGAFDYTWVKSSTTVVNLHYAYNQVQAINNPSGPQVPNYTALGFNSGFSSAIAPLYHYMPQVTIAGQTTWGPANSSIVMPVNQQIAGSVSRVLANHSLKFGFDLRLLEADITPAMAPQFSFAANYTQGPNPTLASATAGYGFASLLLGAGSGSFTSNPPVDVSAPTIAGYVQDDWKVTRRLTVNLGLRYDLFFPRTEAQNRLNYFNAMAPNPLAAATGLNLLGELQFVNQKGAAGTQVPVDYNNFSPRLGLVYAINDKTVLRTGFALVYPPQNYGINVSNAGFQGFESLSQWVSDANSLKPTSPLSTAFQSGLQNPTNGSLGGLTNIGQAISTTSPQYSAVSTYTEQWNFSIQRTLIRNTVLEVSYLGNRGLHLPIYPGYQLDTLPPADMALGTQLTRLVPNPFYGLIQSGTLSGQMTTLGQLLRPFPQYTGLNILFDPGATSGYNALGIHLQSRFSGGYIVTAAYTKGKEIDNSSEQWGTNDAIQNFYNLAAERSLSSQDVSQTFVTGIIAPVPVGKGKALLSGAHGITQALLGGWQMNAIVTLQTGIPLGLTCQSNTTGSSGGGCRPNSTGTPAGLSGPVTDRLNKYFDTSQFTQPANYTFGNVSRALPDVRAPSFKNIDYSIYKNFQVRERIRVQFRAEAFNLTNTPIFGAPNAVFGGPGFGVISTQVNSPRQMQVALRIDF